MPINLKKTGISEKDEEWKLLKEIQGNILKSHGRDHSQHLFITFSDAEKGRAWLKSMWKQVTSAEKQWNESARRADIIAEAEKQGESEEYVKQQLEKNPSSVFINVLLSAKGYAALGLQAKMPKEEAFVRGAGSLTTTRALSDPLQKEWEEGFRKNALHALVIVADDKPENIKGKVKNITEAVEKEENGKFAGKVVHTETGEVLRDVNGHAQEHFGFVDGVSNPMFFEKDIKQEKEKEQEHGKAEEKGKVKYDPSAPLGLVLVKDPGGDKETAYGSFFVYRKLEQDVAKFNAGREAVAKKLAAAQGRQPGEQDTELAGAYMVGRFRDGTPVVENEKAENLGKWVPNNFNYADDENGARCPLHAHTRKVNPRDETHRPQERNRRITRRAISYKNGNKVGLLFLCAQSQIVKQFEFLQQTWANNVDFVCAGTSLDAVIGRGVEPPTHKWPVNYGAAGDPRQKPLDWVEVGIQQAVTMKGGEYFFMPSLPFLEHADQMGKTA